jgi:hypothetical protein
MSSQWAAVIVSIVVGVAGLYLGNSIRRKGRLERETAVIEARFEVYPKLWAATQSAAPMAEVVDPDRALSEEDLTRVYDALDCWFWVKGGGAYLGDPTRTIYFRAKENLKLPDDRLWPESARAKVMALPPACRAHARSAVHRRQLSLLRTAVRADLGVVGRVYRKPLDGDDKDFLLRAGACLWKRPWWSGRPSEWVSERLRRRPLAE